MGRTGCGWPGRYNIRRGLVDAHCHLGPVPRCRFEETSLEGFLPLCDRLGIDRLLATHHADLEYHALAGREEILRAYEMSAGRLQAYCVFDPRRPEAARDCEQLLAHPAYVGIKIHPLFHQTPADSPAYGEAFALAREHDVPLLSHTWYRSAYNPPQALALPGRFRAHLEAFPQVRFILGHGGAGGDGLQEAVEVLREFPQVCADLAGDVYEPGFVEALVAAGGPERVLFASDLPWLDPRPQLGCVLTADLPPGALPLILGENAVRLFRLEDSA